MKQTNISGVMDDTDDAQINALIQASSAPPTMAGIGAEKGAEKLAVDKLAADACLVGIGTDKSK